MPAPLSLRDTLAMLVKRIADNTVSNNAARQVFDALWSR
jgi:Asp-tRNA(Asn)/Glu-tRNA(Gln) amidotransferase B subunit